MFRLMNKMTLVVFYFVMIYPVSGGSDDSGNRAGVQHYRAGRFAEAAKAFEQHLDAHPHDATVLRRLAMTYVSLQHDKKAVKTVAQLLSVDNGNAEHHYVASLAYGLRAQKAGLLKKAGFAKKMKAAVERAIALNPDHLAARKVLMQFHMHAPGFMGGDSQEAMRQAEAIMARDRMRGHEAKAMLHMKAERIDEAEAAYRQSIAEQPDSLAHYYWYQNFLAGQDRTDDAVDVLNQALAVDSTQVKAWMQIGQLSMIQERHERALHAFRSVLQLNPEADAALYQMGKASALSGLALEEALRCLDRYDELNQDGELHAWSLIRRGQIYEHLKRIEKAKSAYAAALSIDKDNQTAKASFKRLNGDS